MAGLPDVRRAPRRLVDLPVPASRAAPSSGPRGRRGRPRVLSVSATSASHQRLARSSSHRARPELSRQEIEMTASANIKRIAAAALGAAVLALAAVPAAGAGTGYYATGNMQCNGGIYDS